MGLYEWLSLALICTFGASSPGPSLIVILSITNSYGRKSGLVAALGHGLAVFFYALISASSLIFFINYYSNLYTFLQFSGAIFLIYLAFRILQSELYFKEKVQVENCYGKFKHEFLKGFLLAILNPKIVIFFVALFSQFLESDQTILTHFTMASLAGVIDVLYYFCIVYFTSTNRIRKLLLNYGKEINLIFASILIILALSLIINLTIRI